MMDTLTRNGSDSLVMEVSSQALKLDRVKGLTYRTAAFTNLYEDHIAPNEHPDMEDYISCKLKIFDNCETGILNLDCEVADRVREYCNGKTELITYSIDGEADWANRAPLTNRAHPKMTWKKSLTNFQEITKNLLR